MRISLPDPEFDVLRTQREDPRISIRVIRVQAYGLHVRADGLGRLSEGRVGVPFPLPQILGLRIHPEGDLVEAEGIRRPVLRHEDVRLEGEGAHIAAVQGHRVVGGRLPGFQSADAQETLPDVGESLRIVFESGGRFPDFEDAEGFDERHRGAGLEAGIEGRDAGLYEVVHPFEHARFSIEEALEEGHPYHPIPQDAAPGWGASDKWPT